MIGGKIMNILYAASEARPYVASGGLADVAGALPLALNAKEMTAGLSFRSISASART